MASRSRGFNSLGAAGEQVDRLAPVGGIVREDSDDELGVEDFPWVWIYAADDEDEQSDEQRNRTPRRKATKRQSRGKKKIVGARMGYFECRIGDTVLLKSPEAGRDWAGIACEFLEEEEKDSNDGSDSESEYGNKMTKCVNIMWFASPDEFMSTKNKKREDALENEQYITVDFNVNPLTSISGKATVLSENAFMERYPDGKPPKGKEALAEYHKCIICRRGVNQLQGRYTEEFVWEKVYNATEQGVFDLIDFIKAGLKRAKRRRHDEDEDAHRATSETPRTPRKRQKTTSLTSTPQSRRSQRYLSTPTHKRIVIKKPLEFTPLGTRILDPVQLNASPYRQARSLLHVSSVPAALPCRGGEFDMVYESLQTAILDGTGACIYISGPPGTGKTATVREVIAHLNNAVLDENMDDFVFVEINGMKITDPHQSYSLLWEALKGDRVSPPHALDLLGREFSHPSPRRVPCVVLMDELDQLVTKNQSVMYNFFNWPALRYSHLVVLAVANTMDLPERTLSNKISSRLGLTRITFSGYKHQELIEIISTRLANVPGNIVDADAVQFASRKVAAVSGDARRALDICRRAVEIAEQVSEAAGKPGLPSIDEEDDDEAMPPTPSKTGRGNHSRADPKPTPRPQPPSRSQPLPRVTIATIKQAIQEATSTPIQRALRTVPLASKLFLAALLARLRRGGSEGGDGAGGLADVPMGDIIDEAMHIAEVSAAAAAGPVAGNLRAFVLGLRPGRESDGRNGGHGNGDKQPATAAATAGSTVAAAAVATSKTAPPHSYEQHPHPRHLRALRIAAADLAAAGVLAVEGSSSSGGGIDDTATRARRSGRVRLRVGADEVRAALGADAAEARVLGVVSGEG